MNKLKQLIIEFFDRHPILPVIVAAGIIIIALIIYRQSLPVESRLPHVICENIR